jgi:flagella basal body P-ring formation protein FlgA
MKTIRHNGIEAKERGRLVRAATRITNTPTRRPRSFASRLSGFVPLAFAACLLAGAGAACRLGAEETPAFQLRPAAQVDGGGIFLNQLIQSETALPALRLCDAPLFGKSAVLTRAQIADLARVAGSDLALTNWAGAEAVRVSRRSRALAEREGLQLLTALLQQQTIKDKGELELRLSRAWTAINVPDEPFTLKVLDMPTMGVTPAFIVRFELETARGEKVGSWQASLQARIWREIWVTHSALKRGDSLRGADLAHDRRDVLALRETLAEFDPEDSALEVADPVPANSPLLARSIRLRTVIHRGQTVAALLEDGALAITMKVEALEDGAPGQIIRLRNPNSRRDLRGKVINEQTILVAL